MKRSMIVISLLGLLTAPVLADNHKLGNSKLKEMGYERLEGKNRYRVGCHHVIRGGDRDKVWHPSYLSSEEIGLEYRGKWVSVSRSDKTRLLGTGETVTVWRKCNRI